MVKNSVALGLFNSVAENHCPSGRAFYNKSVMYYKLENVCKGRAVNLGRQSLADRTLVVIDGWIPHINFILLPRAPHHLLL